MKKIFISLMLGLILLIPTVLAQTGLFTSSGSSTFVETGVTIVVVIIIIRQSFKQLFKRKK